MTTSRKIVNKTFQIISLSNFNIFFIFCNNLFKRKDELSQKNIFQIKKRNQIHISENKD